ncbi:MAG TPA: GNAT family N-acetyltransferase [Pyrinomonadaceae bacterium]|nr:GNAT family N-acetyltransferase [Pyrinomonadaceae bacterium]
MIYVDRTFSQKLERTEGRSNADFVATRAQLEPESGATWIEVGGAYAMFDGVGSPLTQTFGLGIFEDATAEYLDELEAFFKDRGSEVFHEVSPLVDQSMMALLSDRGYRPIELTCVMYQELDESRVTAKLNTQINTRVADDAEADLWAATVAAGWASDQPDLVEFLKGIGKISARTSGGRPFLAELEGRPIAGGGFQMYDDVCILAGASTIPDARRQGAQSALLQARLQYAVDNGCTLAMMCALPGSQSQKNAQKNGFEIAYTRTKWQLTIGEG